MSPRTAAICVVTVAIVTLTAASGQRAAPAFSLSGIVMTDSSGAPMRGARVTVEATPERQAYTDSVGRYRFDSLPYGELFVRAEAIGYIPERRQLRTWCTVAVADDRGRVVTPQRCTAGRERLDFRMRPDRHH